MTKESGQALLIILLATLVALTIGLAITQRSLTDVATSTKIDQSTRAFSAAEAGIEKAQGIVTGFNIPSSPSPHPSAVVSNAELDNQSSVDVSSTGLVPLPADAGIGLEYPAIDKTRFAQFWLADPDTLARYYSNNDFDLYFGNDAQTPTQSDTMPAIEANIVTVTKDPVSKQITGYQSNRIYYDSITRNPDNNFKKPIKCGGGLFSIQTYNTRSSTPTTSTFYCKYNLSLLADFGITNTDINYPILVRINLLYDSPNAPQKIGIAPTGIGVLPAQIIIYTSKGYSGQTQRKLKLFVQKNVVPFYFDYAIFSSGPLTKTP